ncbi:hypothetical protein BC937DRAFT_93245 [Endogone sp. FLAS-F59071]|nr:hypothetical protein BC937DRAFT_93245 [Endogone sp. FLAS-F59071]|eukprot:RUS23032.1 hypothetical protein BC937DRAFT_93245 [Endogone sp. FLAS-F59071]
MDARAMASGRGVGLRRALPRTDNNAFRPVGVGPEEALAVGEDTRMRPDLRFQLGIRGQIVMFEDRGITPFFFFS